MKCGDVVGILFNQVMLEKMFVVLWLVDWCCCCGWLIGVVVVVLVVLVSNRPLLLCCTAVACWHGMYYDSQRML